MPSSYNTRSKSAPLSGVLTNLDGTPHWCPSWCECCDLALERAKRQVKQSKKK